MAGGFSSFNLSIYRFTEIVQFFPLTLILSTEEKNHCRMGVTHGQVISDRLTDQTITDALLTQCSANAPFSLSETTISVEAADHGYKSSLYLIRD